MTEPESTDMRRDEQIRAEFDDARLDDRDVLSRHDEGLRQLALAGAHIRVECAAAESKSLDPDLQPRGIVLAGHGSRLIRAAAETTCPAPLVAWPHGGLPGWAGPLDLVVVQASGGPPGSLLSTIVEASRRGCSLLVAAPSAGPVAEHVPARDVLVPTTTDDSVAAVVALLGLLSQIGLMPAVHAESVADAADMVAERCSPHKDLSVNPAKASAIALADGLPLVWGGSMLAARAARRVAEELRRMTGRPALATPAEDVAAMLSTVSPRDPFADPVDDWLRPALVTLDDGDDDAPTAQTRATLEEIAAGQQVRVVNLECDDDAGPIGRHVSLLQQGFYMAAYLAVGLDRL